MPNYSNGKIYAIRSHQTDKVYVGSTTQALSVRFGGHKRQSHYYTSTEILQHPDAYIELIENFPCENKDQLCKREGEIIRSMECVNKQIPTRTIEEYRETNKDKIKEQVKEYSIKNKDKIKEWRTKYLALKKASSLSPKLTTESV